MRLHTGYSAPAGQLLTTSAATVYQAPASRAAVVNRIPAYNDHSSAIVVTVYVVPAGETLAAKHIVHKESVASKATLSNLLSAPLFLNPGDKVSALAATAAKVAVHAQVLEYEKTSNSAEVSPLRFKGGGVRQGVTATGAAAALTAEFVAESGGTTVLESIYVNNTHNDVVNLTLYRQKASGVVASASDAEKLAFTGEIAAGAAEPILTGDIVLEAGDKIIVISDVAAKALLNFQYKVYNRAVR